MAKAPKRKGSSRYVRKTKTVKRKGAKAFKQVFLVLRKGAKRK